MGQASQRSIAFLTALTTLSTSSALLIQASEAAADTLQRRHARPVGVQPILTLSSRISLRGIWQGYIYPEGDDVLTAVELQISASGSSYQGIWKQIGSAYNANTDEWEPTVLQQGTLTAWKQDDAVAIDLIGFSGNGATLEGNLSNGGTAMSGQIAGSTHFVFHFNKSR